MLPFSKTSSIVAKIIKEHYTKLLENEDLEGELPINIVTAYTRHKNIGDSLISAKLI